MIKEGYEFRWGNNQKAIVVKVLDEELGLFYCVYHQNGLKYVVAEFSFSDGDWILSNDPGRVIESSEWPQYVSQLESSI